MSNTRKHIADAAFLIALILYILGGVRDVPFHPDEAMQISMSRDVFLMQNGADLAFVPPLERDTEPYLRLINGTLSKLTIGIVWQLSGRTEAQLPRIYAWEQSLEWNRERGNVPDAESLFVARIPSSIMTALGVVLLFLIGWQLRLRAMAYPAALLYALHPAILLNGRRAMMEGSLILFTLLSVCWLLALIIAEHSATGHRTIKRIPSPIRYALLGVLVGLTVAAKHTGLVIAAAVLAASTMAIWARTPHTVRAFVGTLAQTTLLALVVALITWLLLNPAYWRDPLGGVRAAAEARAELLAIQTRDAAAHTDLLSRIGAILNQPFLTPPQFFEAPNWVGVIDDQIEAYRESAFDGWEWSPLVGVALTVFAGIGLLVLVWDALHRDLVARAMLLWVGAALAASIVIPLNWQRYYLPLILVAILLAATGLGRMIIRDEGQ
jgi:4-amino-4-deoxy-L-arabinose transferase-like glycosyltransferase